jgi:ribonuclease HI
MPARPDYLLFTEALKHASGRYLWRFMLLAADSDQTVTASDLVDEASATRMELLALVRGLEAAEAPANVRLFTSSGYISRGLARGLTQWRSQRWHWERFGRRVPIRDCDLWQRVDHALGFHTVDCRLWGEADHTGDQLSLDVTHETPSYTVSEAATAGASDRVVTARPNRTTTRPYRRRNRPGALGKLRQQVESLLEPRLIAAG